MDYEYCVSMTIKRKEREKKWAGKSITEEAWLEEKGDIWWKITIKISLSGFQMQSPKQRSTFRCPLLHFSFSSLLHFISWKPWIILKNMYLCLLPSYYHRIQSKCFSVFYFNSARIWFFSWEDEVHLLVMPKIQWNIFWMQE